MAKQIFVIGRDRSGTKWLSNIIAAHKEVACVQHKDHFGILEASDILDFAPILFGNILIPENFIAFIECFSQTDFFKLTGLDKDYFYELRPTDYFIFFREMMDLFADNEGKNYWVQKSGTSSLDDLYRHFPDGKFIIIIRNLKDNIRSKIGQRMLYTGKNKKKHILKESIKYFIDMSQIKKISNRSNVYVVQYEDLIKNRKSVVENLCEFLKIKFNEIMLQDKFRKNTSFKNGVSREEILTKSDLFKIDILSLFLKSLPWWVYGYLHSRRKHKIGKQLFDPQEKKFISFKLRKKELGWE